MVLLYGDRHQSIVIIKPKWWILNKSNNKFLKHIPKQKLKKLEKIIIFF